MQELGIFDYIGASSFMAGVLALVVFVFKLFQLGSLMKVHDPDLAATSGRLMPSPWFVYKKRYRTGVVEHPQIVQTGDAAWRFLFVCVVSFVIVLVWILLG